MELATNSMICHKDILPGKVIYIIFLNERRLIRTLVNVKR